mmetsp:Transcript_2123/g.8983  ORF Transcript_2123/g.8983 Transcript_2123/m.8983 type:complete len:261 (+) Transcript_2123:665-1447(+)
MRLRVRAGLAGTHGRVAQGRSPLARPEGDPGAVQQRGHHHRVRAGGGDRQGGRLTPGREGLHRRAAAEGDAPGTVRVSVHADGSQLCKLPLLLPDAEAHPDRLRRREGVPEEVRRRLPSNGGGVRGEGQERAHRRVNLARVFDRRRVPGADGRPRRGWLSGGQAVRRGGRVRFRRRAGHDAARGGTRKGDVEAPTDAAAEGGVLVAPKVIGRVSGVHEDRREGASEDDAAGDVREVRVRGWGRGLGLGGGGGEHGVVIGL